MKTTETNLRALMQAGEEVKKLCSLAELLDGRWIYLIETTREGTDKYVVGIVDAEGERNLVLKRSERRSQAQRAYTIFQQREDGQ